MIRSSERNITVILDDQDEDIKYLCPTTAQTVVGPYYNATWSTIEKGTPCASGWFEHTFYGTGVQIQTSMSRFNQNYSAKIDDGPLLPQAGRGYYASPRLPDGRHTVTYAVGALDLLPTFDYLTLLAGPSTPLQGRTIIVSDTDATVVYRGNWKADPPAPLQFDFSTALYQDTAHWSSTVGDSLEFHFIGTSVSVYGIVTGNLTENTISAIYSIDGNPTSHPIPKDTLEAFPMIVLFQAPNLQPGTHTLLVNVTNIAPPQAVGFDFIAYNASFGTIAEASGPVSDPPSPSSPGAGSGSGSSGSVEENEGHTRVIVGGAVAGGVVLAILLFLAFLWKRKAQHGGRCGSENPVYGAKRDGKSDSRQWIRATKSSLNLGESGVVPTSSHQHHVEYPPSAYHGIRT